MKKIKLFLMLLFISFGCNSYSQFNYQRSWGTYFGDERFYFSDSKIDNEGNLYIVGTINGTESSNFPIFTNTNSYQSIYGGGDTDGFIAKFNPAGNLVWGTFFGGESMDKIGGIAIDHQNNIYIVGSTYSISNVATPNSYQINNAGNGDYFIAKFNSSGVIAWSTYFGGSETDFDLTYIDSSRTNISFDGANYIYISGLTFSNTLATPNVFQENRGTSNYQISKFDIAGNRVWTTYYGVNTHISSLKANSTSVYASGYTTDCPPTNSYNTYYGTSGSQQAVPGNCRDVYLSKFNSNGQREWSTYYGGSGSELVSNNSIDLYQDKVFFSGYASNYSNQEIATAGSYQPNTNGSSHFITQFNENGNRNWGTYNGNVGPNQSVAPSNVHVSHNGDFYNYGFTGLTDITTSGAFKTQLSNAYNSDGFVCKFDANGNKIWGTYYGGELGEKNIKFHPYNTSFFIVGVTNSSTEIATSNGYQPSKQVFDLINNSQQSASNIFITHFEPLPLSNETFESSNILIYPNPNNGNFTVKFKNNGFENATIEVSDILGKKVYQQNLLNEETIINTNDLSKGIYLLKVKMPDGTFYNSKIVVE